MTYRHDNFEHIESAPRRMQLRDICLGLPRQDVYQVAASYEDYGSGDGEYSLFICAIIGIFGENLQHVGNYHETHRTSMHELIKRAAWELFAVTEQEAMTGLALYEPSDLALWYYFRDLYTNRLKVDVDIDTSGVQFD